MPITLHANGEPLLKWSSLYSQSATILLVVCSANGDGSHHPSEQIEQGANYIIKSLIYSMRKAFLEKAVVELVYKFVEKSYSECLKR